MTEQKSSMRSGRTHSLIYEAELQCQTFYPLSSLYLGTLGSIWDLTSLLIIHNPACNTPRFLLCRAISRMLFPLFICNAWMQVGSIHKDGDLQRTSPFNGVPWWQQLLFTSSHHKENQTSCTWCTEYHTVLEDQTPLAQWGSSTRE